MGANNVWEITLNSELADQACANVFYYRGNALTSPEAEDIAQSFEEQILPDILAATAADVFFTGLTVRDLLADDTPVFYPLGVSGDQSGADTLPAHDAFGFTMNVVTNLTRPGGKRFPGVLENTQVDGVVTDGSVIAVLNDLALTLAFNLFDHATGLVPWAAAVIVKRILDGDSYRLPEVLGELVTNAVSSVSPSLIITSQTSRRQRAP